MLGASSRAYFSGGQNPKDKSRLVLTGCGLGQNLRVGICPIRRNLRVWACVLGHIFRVKDIRRDKSRLVRTGPVIE